MNLEELNLLLSSLYDSTAITLDVSIELSNKAELKLEPLCHLAYRHLMLCDQLLCFGKFLFQLFLHISFLARHTCFSKENKFTTFHFFILLTLAYSSCVIMCNPLLKS